MRRLLGMLLLLTIALLPATAVAQEGTPEPDDGDALIRISSDVTVAEGESLGSLIVIDGNVRIEGTVRDFLLVIDGDVTVNGMVEGDLTVISGDIDLGGSAIVENVNSISGDLKRAPGSTVTGDVNERDSFGFLSVGLILFSIVFWAGLTIAVIIAGLIFAAAGGRQLSAAARAMTGQFVSSVVGGVFLWIGLPILGVLAFITLVGIPIGLGIFVFLLPAMVFLGYIVAGARLGSSIIGMTGRDGEPKDHPYAATTLGLVILQLLILVPVVGIIVAVLAGLWGGGTLALLAYRAAGGKSVSTDTAVT